MNEFCSDIITTLIGVLAGGLLTILANYLSNKSQFELNRKLENEFFYKKMILKELTDAKEVIKNNHKLVLIFIDTIKNYDAEKANSFLIQFKDEIAFELSRIVSITPFLEGFSENDKAYMNEIHLKEKLEAYLDGINKIINIDIADDSKFARAFALFANIMNNKFFYEDSYKDVIEAINKSIDYYIKSLNKSK